MNNSYNWYRELRKPKWAPPSWLFSPVWSVLYILIFISFGSVFYKFFNGEVTFIVLLPFILNIFFNAIFTTLQFKLKSNLLAMIDILLVLLTLVWLMVAIYPIETWVTYINIPYFLWVSFATILQLTITHINRK